MKRNRRIAEEMDQQARRLDASAWCRLAPEADVYDYLKLKLNDGLSTWRSPGEAAWAFRTSTDIVRNGMKSGETRRRLRSWKNPPMKTSSSWTCSASAWRKAAANNLFDFYENFFSGAMADEFLPPSLKEKVPGGQVLLAEMRVVCIEVFFYVAAQARLRTCSSRLEQKSTHIRTYVPSKTPP